MKREKCGQEFDESLGKCPHCIQEGQVPESAPEATDAVASASLEVQPTHPFSDEAVLPKKKRNILIGVGAACFALIAILIALFAVNQHQEQEYQLQIELGYRYLAEGNYEEAILAFNAAIEIRPKRGEPYVGRGDVYTAMESFEEARDSYEQALELDNSLVDAYIALANAYLELGDLDVAMSVLKEGFEITQDSEIALWLDALRSMVGTASLQGTVSEYLAGGGNAPLPGARVRIYTTATAQPRLVRAETTGSDGAFAMNDLAAGTFILHVDAVGHIGLITTEDLEEGTVKYTELYLLIPSIETEASDGFHATVTNAINGEGVPEAEVLLRPGWNNTDGELSTLSSIVADYDGNIHAQDLDYGYYTAEVRADNFTTSFHNVAVVPQEFYTEWNLPISPKLADGETRIVLTWGEQPSDLDSHLYNSDFHVAFWDTDYYQNDEHLVNLDLDDISSYGPETITLYRQLDKDCTYYVHDYTNGGNNSSTQLSTSGATVRVYQAAGLVATFHVPTGGAGDRWTVFTLKADGTIVPVNSMGMDDYSLWNW